MGEAVSAEPSTGTFAIEVPVVVPPGPRGFEPDVTIRYSSCSGNGPIGLGWFMAIPEIARRTDHGLPRYQDGSGPPSDELLWMGRRLIQVSPDTWRLRVEGEFTRVVSLGGAADGFRADRHDGSKVFLGTSPDSQVVADGRIFRWLPDRAVDPFGNEITYAYSRDQGQLYLTDMRYGSPGAPRARVSLLYEPRDDVQLDLRAGFPISTARRLVAIETRVGGEPGTPVRRVMLRYAEGPGVSKLATVQTCGFDQTTCLPPLSFTFTGKLGQGVVQSFPAPGISLNDPDAAILDVDGDSLPDVVKMTPQRAVVWKNLGPKGFAPMAPLAGAPGIALSSPGVAFQDMDGDGRADLLVAFGASGTDGYAYWPMEDDRLGVEIAIASSLKIPPSSPQLRWIDLDGDGRVDAVLGQADGWVAYLNLGTGSFGPPFAIDSPLPGLVLDDARVHFADMNDDGLVDVVLLQSGSLQISFNRGPAGFSPLQAMTGVPDVQGDDQRLALGDADGDGLPDLYYVASGRLSLWLNRGDGSFGPETQLANAPSYDPLTTTVRFVDLLGNGTHGVLYSGAGDGRPFLWFFDPSAGERPNLIARVDNGMGGIRRVDYVSTGKAMATASASGHPWISFAPFPQSVVASLELDDGVSVPEVDFRSYRDPRYDGHERLFQGFASARRELPGDAHAMGSIEDTVFHVGLNEDLCLVGSVASTSELSASGVVFRRSVWDVQGHFVTMGIGGESACFAARVSTTREIWENQAQPLRERTRSSFDAHGNETERRDDGRIDGPPDPAADRIRHTYTEDESVWLLGLVAEQEIIDARGQRVALERRYYDGSLLGEVRRGALTRVQSWIESDRFVDTRDNEVDDHGNVTAWTDADGRRVETDYDSERHQFPIEERHNPGSGSPLRFLVKIDPATGKALSFREANGAWTHYQFDAIGRLVSIERPIDPQGEPGELRSYELGPSRRVLRRSRRATPGAGFTLQEADLFDGFLRPLAHVTSAENGAFAVSGRVQRDIQGHDAVHFAPFFADALTDIEPPSAAPDSKETYDSLSRVLTRTLLAGGQMRWVYGQASVTIFDAESASGKASPERRFFDWKGRVSSVDLAVSGRQPVTYGFESDPRDRVLARRSPLGTMATAAYDGLGRLVSVIDADAGQVRWTHDGAGHPLSRTDAAGRVLRWSYDQAGRLLTADGDGGRRATYRYDLPGSEGRLGEVDDQSGKTRYAYDDAGRLTGFSVSQEGDGMSLALAYDGADRLTDVRFPDGQAVAYRYGGRGLVTSIPGLLEDASYDAAGNPMARVFTNGMIVRIGRDAAERVVALHATTDIGDRLSLAYGLRASGALFSATDEEGRTDFEQDDQERLTMEVSPRGVRRQTYDWAGRMSSRTSAPEDPRLPGRSMTFGVGAGPDALASDQGGSYRYDAMGQRVASRALALSYDGEGQLVAASGDVFSARYGYGFDGERRSREVRFSDGRTTSELRFGPWVEIDDGALWEHVMVGTERIASLAGDLQRARVLAGASGDSSGCESGSGGSTLGALALVFGLKRTSRKLGRP
jgi:YD repeat-containing protein